jgi:hypothetical protein
MKKKTQIFRILFFLSVLASTEGGCQNISKKNTLNTILKISTKENKYFKNLLFLGTSDIYRDTLYIVNKSQFLTVDIATGRVDINNEITAFLTDKMKAGVFATDIIIKDAKYYISFPKSIYVLSSKGFFLYSYRNEKNIYAFSVTAKGNLLVASIGKISLIDNKGKAISSIGEEELSTPWYFSFNDGLGYLNFKKIFFFTQTLENGIKKLSVDIDLVNGKDENFYPSYATDDVFIGFSYFHRDKLYYIPMKNNLQSVKELKLGNDFSPTEEENQNEEGTPNFKIIGNNNFCYVLALQKDILTITKIIF